MPDTDPFDDLKNLFPQSPAGGLAPKEVHKYAPTRQEPAARPAKRMATRAEAAPPPPDDSQPYQPTQRPPLARICILDDGSSDGEWVRIRNESFIIGRTEGDIRLPFDSQLAPRHAEIAFQSDGGKHIWRLNDLQTPTGTFVEVTERPLRGGAEMWIGGRRYRFEQSMPGVLPTLQELAGDRRAFVLDPPGVFFGRDGGPGTIAVADDPCLARRHARFEVAPDGSWKIINLGSRNGVYLRINSIKFAKPCRFQAGEQRFLVEVVR